MRIADGADGAASSKNWRGAARVAVGAIVLDRDRLIVTEIFFDAVWRRQYSWRHAT
jgi:hypothetical protein